MKSCAFLSLDEPGNYVIDDVHAIAPLNALGWQVSTLSWRQSARPWSDFDLVVIRSTWDYYNDVSAFLETLEKIDRETQLANRVDLVRWNLAKTYLQDLQQQGIGVVPTLWVNSPATDFASEFQNKLAVDDIVIKPVVGANGEDAFRIKRDETPERVQRIAARFCDRDCMIQPFMPSIKDEGEYSLFFFAGVYSHTVLKLPADSEFRSQEELGGRVSSAQPQAALLQRAHQAMDTISPAPLYARVDLVRSAADDFLVMEFELIEPSLYLRMDPHAPGRFAASIAQWAQSA